ncbi:MAG: DNA mismatch repair endonuclease MutL [Planctomycetaceae bacterium]|nr:DNA mismatch repair endonuclease MutL [Planctomycetaceae bacterium]MCB9950797.1 DNA mismatch repair endonuclease MutL [Planctomycetaceae bacterium]
MSVDTDVATRIQQLSQSVINKIAAGEVIERPASVVKELLENSVDALSTRIDVDIEQGGADLIRIVDNGEGIHPEDFALAVASHATSKIRSADDLFSVQTMGFRGEALASISEVSNFRVRSRQADQETGLEMEVNGGVASAPRPCGCPVGTQMEVRQLFFNTPVRRKFLKTQSTEFAHISEQFTRIALANPGLQMNLRHNGKQVYQLPASTSHLERLRMFFGSELAGQLIAVDGEYEGVRLWGFVGHPSLSKSNRKGQYLFLNGRWIQDRSLQHALSEAYRGLLMVGRHPVAFLFLELSPEQVDVNVHPTKSEVRFRDSQTLYRLVLSSLRNRFLSMDLDSQIDVSRANRFGKKSVDEDDENTDDSEPRRLQQELVAWTRQQLPQTTSPQSPLPTYPAPQPTGEASVSDSDDAASPLDAYADDLFATPSVARTTGESSSAPIVHVDDSQAAAYPTSGRTALRAMQVHDCYLVVESEQGIMVIDQHALHERIMYEYLRERILGGKVEIQRLLIPLTIELSARECHLLLDQVELLKELGILIESFGGTTIMVTGYPAIMKKADPTKLLRDISEMLETSGSKLTRRDLLDSSMHMMACKAAIKAGQRLSSEEIESLLEQRHLCEDHHHCPHGRPTALVLSRSELDRQFGRLG